MFKLYLSPDDVAAPAPEAPEQIPAPEAPQVDAPWYSSIEDESLRGHAEVKGWKSPVDAVKSHMEAEKFLGAPKDSLLRMPEELTTENLLPLFDKLGRPEDAAGYELQVADGADQEFLDWFGNTAHANGLTKEQAKGLMDQYNQYYECIVNKMGEETELKAQAELKELQQKWGNNYAKNEDLAKRAAREFGIEADVLDGLGEHLGLAKTLELFANIGSKMVDHKFVDGQPSGDFHMTPQAAKAKLDMLLHDQEFMKKIQAGDSKTIEMHSKLVAMSVGA